MSAMEEERGRAKDWFYELRDQICAAFEGLEDAQKTGPHAGLDAGRFERTPTTRPGICRRNLVWVARKAAWGPP